MNKKQRIVALVALTLILATFLYPCWQRMEVHEFENHIQTAPTGTQWAYVFWPPKAGDLYEFSPYTKENYKSGSYYYRILWELQISQFLTILIICGGLFLIFKSK